MFVKKSIIAGFIFVLIVATILISYAKDNMHSKKRLPNVSMLIENEYIEDLSLTVYYESLNFFTLFPWNVDNLINSDSVKKTVINGSDLEEHIYLLKQISMNDLVPVQKKSYLDARLYYVLESKKNGKLFDVAMGGDESIFVNGIEVKKNVTFFDAIRPFLPEQVAKEFELYFDIRVNGDGGMTTPK